jgi:hypothetical protein
MQSARFIFTPDAISTVTVTVDQIQQLRMSETRLPW